MPPTVALEPPLPLTPPVSRCQFPELVVEVIPLRMRQHRPIEPCFVTAIRRVTVGLATQADVCLWHSLVARERLGAHLVRDLVST
ncbi:hypothetical protein OHA21_43645 [Actinoplanes sp. NBC_00393]|uniref:hypothetical protein n=1 Tax=Actinoplanes sp. NBC_00393 TaxID=2975953 RepID=UPI002E1F63A9